MAKKVVATLKMGAGKTETLCIKMIKSPETGAYMFKEKMVAKDKYLGTDELNAILKEEIAALLEENKNQGNFDLSYATNDGNPYIIMVVGVNGVGKTTTIGKLA